jgi:large subunit ribosomal protein L15
MKLNTFTTFKKRSKRVGRGISAGQGKTAGRGHKGQKARTGKKLRAGFEGGQTPIFQRLPKYRGFRNPNEIDYQIINVGDLNDHKGNTITVVSLFELKLVAKKNQPVKILGTGELKKAFSIEVEKASESAIAKITAAGGTFTSTYKSNKLGKEEAKKEKEVKE